MSDGNGGGAARKPQDFSFNRFWVDLRTREVRYEKVPCRDLEDVLGGAARGYKLLEERPVDDAYDPGATLVMNLGLLTGSAFMTGLRTYFHAYSPQKVGAAGKPGAMWTAGSDKFGVKLRTLGLEEVVFTGRAETPTVLRLEPAGSPTGGDGGGPVKFHFDDGAALRGQKVNARIQALYKQYPQAHFAVVGPAGDNYQQVRFAAIALSTENQLKSGDPKPRWCGRGGIGGVMGSKNLVGIVADVKDPAAEQQPPELKPINMEVARGKGSSRFRDKAKNGGGGTWSNYDALNPVHSMPEYNFNPTATDISVQLYRDNVEHTHVVKDEACYRCGIRCHKNVYEKGPDGKAGRFLAKLDYEPLNLLSSNLGIFDIDQACHLVELVDEMGMDNVSCGTTLAYAMEYNRRHKGDGKQVAGGLSYGDFEATAKAVEDMGHGRLEELGQGTKRLAERTGEPGYAMHCKGMEFPAYMPQFNPGYPFALAGGHMSMRTYLLCLYERETGLDYWVDAITRRGPLIMRDDIIGICKFTGLPDSQIVESIRAISGLGLSEDDLRKVVYRTYLRGYRIERRQGFADSDYTMPEEVHWEYPQIDLPYFNTPEFFAQLQPRVLARFDELAQAEGLAL